MAGRVKHRSVTPRLYDKPKKLHYEFDEQAAKEMLESSLIRSRGLSREPAIGKCYDCGKPVTGERKTCGLCSAKRLDREK